MAKGLISLAGLEEITLRFVDDVEKRGGRIRGVYYCPHREEDGCECRKPKPGLLLKAQRGHRFAFADTFLVGDSETDLLAGREGGCPTLLISESVSNPSDKSSSRSVPVFSSLYAAVRYIIGQGAKEFL